MIDHLRYSIMDLERLVAIVEREAAISQRLGVEPRDDREVLRHLLQKGVINWSQYSKGVEATGVASYPKQALKAHLS